MMEWSQPSHPDNERESGLRVMSGISSVLLLSELVDLSKVVLLATPAGGGTLRREGHESVLRILWVSVLL